ncbi:hypothetical protein H8B06_16130 [Sphingobacterium sp. DN00404]|uniref:Uncharacterized protein n=1 Tax=Sphingobacterium micropteri TaxID=2763501 RepID=A0ABR7YT13_9SPHI|nr:hypothetical protein [Sphingobacterium micropteri]
MIYQTPGRSPRNRGLPKGKPKI